MAVSARQLKIYKDYPLPVVQKGEGMEEFHPSNHLLNWLCTVSIQIPHRYRTPLQITSWSQPNGVRTNPIKGC